MYNIFKFILFIFFTVHITSVHAQCIEGIILSKDNSEPISGALVYAKGFSNAVETDSLGKFKLLVGEDGRYLLYCKADEFEVDSQWVVVGKQPCIIVKSKLSRINGVTQLEDVVISGTMNERKLMDSPIPVESYSPSFFKKNPSPSVFEALGMINGVQAQVNCNVCNTGDIHINGLEGPYTMVLIDGMPIVSSLATVYGFQGIPQSLIRRIEVVKGPSSTLYGSEAVAGVINIITKDPEKTEKLFTDVSFTSLGELNLDVSTKIKMGKSVTALLGGNYFNYSVPKDVNNDGFTDITQQKRVSLFNKYIFQRKSNKKTSLSARLVWEDRWGGQMGYTKALRGSDSIYSESILTNRLELIGSHALKTRELLRVDVSYNYHLQDSYYGITKYLASQHTAFTQLVWDKKWSPKFSQVSGLPLRFTRYDDNTVGTPNAANTFLPGIFSQGEYKFNTKHTLLLGLRYDYNSLHGSIVTPRFSYKFSPSSLSVVRFTTGSGYRVVNVFTEEHASLTGSRTVEVKSNLKPEKTWNANLNYSRKIVLKKGFMSFDASAFYTYFFNKIIPDYTTDANKIIYDNIAGHAISQGVSVNHEWQLDNSFKTNIGLTYLDVYRKDQNGRTNQLLSPKLNAKIVATYSSKKHNLSFDVTADIKSPMPLPVVPNDFRPAQSPTFCLLGAQATKKVKHAEVYFGVKNILNFFPKYPLLRSFDPFDKHVNDTVANPYGYTFDTNYNYAPLQGIKWYAGLRYYLN